MKYLPINWQDGMKIRRDHLQGQDLAHRAEMHDLAQAQLSPYSFGLLPPRPGESGHPFDLWVKLDQSGQMVVTLTNCRLLSPSGAYFELTPQDDPCTLQATVSQIREQFPQAKHCYVVLEVNPYKRTPTGGADPEEHPPRFRFTRPHFRLKLSNVVQSSATPEQAFDFTLGRIELGASEPKLDESFFPACASYLAHHRLAERFDAWVKVLEEIERQSRQTLNRIRTLGQEHSEDLFLSEAQLSPVAKLVTIRVLYLTGDILALQHLYRNQPPIVFFSAMQRHARSLLNALAEIGPDNTKQWLNFLSQSIKLDDYKSAIEKMVGHRYDHLELGQAKRMVDAYLNMLGRLYHAQSGLPTSKFSWTNIGTIIIDDTTPGHKDDHDIF